MDGSAGIAGLAFDATSHSGAADAAVGPGAAQHTLGSAIDCGGVGVHSGKRVTVRLRPGAAGTGIVFRRTDLDAEPIAATADAVCDTRLCTTVGRGGNTVSTIEHLMAALVAERIDNALIEVDGPELPILDGSAADWVFLIGCAGRRAQRAARRVLTVLRTVRVTEGEAWAELSPTPRAGAFELSMTIDFAAGAIGTQTFSATLTPLVFRRDLAWARTFVMAGEIAALQAAGLARGGSLANAVVVEDVRVLNPDGLRAADEFVRHKMLDAVGDLGLAGAAIEGRFRGVRSGHALNNRLLLAWLADGAAFADSSEGAREAA